MRSAADKSAPTIAPPREYAKAAADAARDVMADALVKEQGTLALVMKRLDDLDNEVAALERSGSAAKTSPSIADEDRKIVAIGAAVAGLRDKWVKEKKVLEAKARRGQPGTRGKPGTPGLRGRIGPKGSVGGACCSS